MARECILFFLLCLFSVTGVSCLTCKKCITEECVPSVNCTGGTVRDPCKCCMECAKVEGESCGGLHGTLGECDKGLSCNREVKHGEAVSDVDSKDGICHLEQSGSCFGCNIKNDERCYCANTGCSENNPVAFKYKDYNSCKLALEEGVTPAYGLNCSQVMCTPVPQMLCPPDSEVIETQRADADSCCPKPGRCICGECRPAVCDEPGWQEVIVRRGNSSTPGSCCDLYECKYKDEECQLPMTNCSAPDCPDDSVLVSHPAERVFTPCCTKSISCKCDQSKCTQLRCPAGQEPIGDRKPATNVPGSCCDKLDCKKESVFVRQSHPTAQGAYPELASSPPARVPSDVYDTTVQIDALPDWESHASTEAPSGVVIHQTTEVLPGVLVGQLSTTVAADVVIRPTSVAPSVLVSQLPTEEPSYTNVVSSEGVPMTEVPAILLTHLSSGDGHEDPYSNLRNFVLIVGIAVLVCVLIIVALIFCFLHQRRKVKKRYQNKPHIVSLIRAEQGSHGGNPTASYSCPIELTSCRLLVNGEPALAM
ncbi:PREDICTED: cysteine-rich motor neuron 1 protein-like isoform X2 [Priapulus caudatus]|uniref:Cysteine-rich motor neuron 1 protein-like isoform X2 n=1 Tax=Priapulus caudatus TaxID=37621 RepID=A0ABM1F7E8_PRICU|nr:PREDICTED: cysteine-rich motor neuron 1 protein-like isoform X2 [Priapulus caudatus]